MLKTLLTSLLILFAVIPGFSRDNEPQYIRIHPYKVKINDSLCYQVREGNNKRIIWEPFCGQFRNFVYREGYEYTVYVKKYDPEADSMFVTKAIASSDVRVDVSQEILLDRLMKQKAKSSSATNHRLSSGEPQYMKVYPYKIRVNDSLCYEVGPGYRKEDEGSLLKEPFCGVFKNFNFEEGKGYTLAVEKYNPQEDTLLVIRALPYPWVSKEALVRKAEQLKKKSAPQAEFMRLHSELIKVNDSLCYQVRKEYSGIDTTAWEPFCGVLDNFYFRSWYEYTLQVEEYNPHADTVCVIKTIAQYPKGQFMKIHSERIKVNDSLCYQVRKGFSRRDKTPWEPFCGKFSNLWCEEGYEYTLHVKEYNPHADTIFVIKTVASYEVPRVFMSVHKERITVNDSLCYQIRKGFSRRDATAWEPFCGKFSNFWYEEGEEYTLQVKEYNPHADTIFVIKKNTRSSVDEEKLQKILREKRMRLKEKERNDTIRAIPVKRRKMKR